MGKREDPCLGQERVLRRAREEEEHRRAEENARWERRSRIQELRTAHRKEEAEEGETVGLLALLVGLTLAALLFVAALKIKNYLGN